MAGFPGSFGIGLPAASPVGGITGAVPPNILSQIRSENWPQILNALRQYVPYLQTLGGQNPVPSPGPGMHPQNLHPVNRMPISSPGPGMRFPPPNFGPVNGRPIASPGPGMQNPILQALSGLRNMMPGINQ